MPIPAAFDTGGRGAVLPRGRRRTQALADAPTVLLVAIAVDQHLERSLGRSATNTDAVSSI
jgi:hypothetical protein